MIKEIICTCCPNGCHLSVDTETLNVTGNTCPRGVQYGKSELTHPQRMITSTVRIKGSSSPRVSVRSDKPLPKELMFKVMEELNKVEVQAPCHIGDIVIPHVIGTDSNIIITKEMEKC